MTEHTPIELLRDCEAVQIPSGLPITLPAGTEVVITQALGGSYTVATHEGLAKISGNDADALGKEIIEFTKKPEEEEGESSIDDVWEQLRTCFDPEIPVNIVDLGLVYDCELLKNDEGKTRVEIKMTLTAPGCGMGPAIAREAEEKIVSLPGISEANVEMVWEPAWNQEMISEAGRMQLGLI